MKISTKPSSTMSIDIGSNAIRMICANRHGQIIHRIREPIRLGTDVFSQGQISKFNINRTIQLFQNFKKIANDLGSCQIRAVGTSALREAGNQHVFIKLIGEHSGISIETIDDQEESQLIHLALNQNIKKIPKTYLSLDIGGGSVEIAGIENSKIIVAQSLKIGTVRMMIEQQNNGWSLHKLKNYLDSQIQQPVRDILSRLESPPQLCFGTGGNLRSLGKIAKKYFHKNKKIDTKTFDQITFKLTSLSVEKRQSQFQLSENRSEVIVYAALVVQLVLKHSHITRLCTPRLGLVEGLLTQMTSPIKKLALPNAC